MGEPLRNTFSWSVSRDRAFRTCPRQYWFTHYGFWGGWEWEADERTREIYVLKQLRTRAMWVGERVHQCIRTSLENLARGIPVLPVDEILAITRQGMRADFRASRDGAYRTNPKNACGLFEHEYRVPVTDQEWRETADQVDRCLRNFYDSDAWAQLCRTRPSDFLEIERFSKFMLDGVEVMVRMDCATRESDHVVVWDWKTGRRDGPDAALQLACYAFYVHQAYGIPIGRVRMRRFELLRRAMHEDTIGEKALDELLAYVRGSIADMQAVLDDPARNLASEERFAKVARRDVCSRCSFAKVCRPELPGGPGPV